MDPNATLTYLREHIEDFRMGQPMDTEAVATLFEELDEWLTVKRGFLPDDWQPKS